MGIENRVAPRVRILGLHRIGFTPADPGAPPLIQVSNISASGVGFLRASHPEWPGKDQLLSGRLSIGDATHAIAARVMHVSPQVVGCRFEGSVAGLDETIERYFDVELAALRARPMNPMVLKKDPRGNPNWYVADNNSELYYIENGGKIVFFRLSVFGNYMDGGEDKAVSYGYERPEAADGEVRKGSVLIETTTSLPPEVVRSAVRFIENISKLPEDIRARLLGWIK